MSLYCGVNPEYVFDPCAVENAEPGRIIAVAAVRSDSAVRNDQTTLATWEAAVIAGTVIVIPNVSGEKPKSEDVKVDGVGLSQSISVGRNFTAAYMHYDVVGNENFYNNINYSKDFSFWYFTSGDTLWDTGEYIADWDGDFVITNVLASVIQWDVAIAWSGRLVATAYNAAGLVSIFRPSA